VRATLRTLAHNDPSEIWETFSRQDVQRYICCGKLETGGESCSIPKRRMIRCANIGGQIRLWASVSFCSLGPGEND
jgi:hypothetical protein